MKNALKLRVLSLVLALAGPLLLTRCAGCPTPLISDLVIIKYRQVGNFNRWRLLDQSGSIDNGMFMRFNIIAIQNTDTHPKTFHFDPGKISAEDPTQKPQPFIYLMGALPFDVTAGTTFTERLGLTLRVPGDPNSLKTTTEALHYASGPDEHVLIIPDASNPQPTPYFDPLTNTGV
jgi:hypothetical protein